MDPFISVVVTAHDRRRYLPEALRSLEAQTLGKDRFEVIVVRNFEDSFSDGIIRRNGWKNIVTDVVPVGGKMAIGLQEAKGEVITFLEDDDMYAPERLQAVAQAFTGLRGLVYFHNAQVAIDEEGRAVASVGLGAELTVDDPPRRCRELFVEPGGFHNSSSIAVSSRLRRT